MTTSNQHPHEDQSIRQGRAAVTPHNNNAEWMMAALVLFAVAMSIVSSMAGFADAEGKEKNGVRRAASQLERKIVKAPMFRAGQVQIG
ncbi:MAG: hypothetical protein ACI89J_001134 [Hyphomicrobiaceae bacterium]|jgi:hypothetical protein